MWYVLIHLPFTFARFNYFIPLSALRHPNIVLFMGSCYDDKQKEMLLVMEWCSRGSLHDLLHDDKTHLPYELLLHLACQAAQGMNFLHKSDPPIIHRFVATTFLFLS